MMESKLKVLISVLNWNNSEHTIQCIRSLKKLKYSNYNIVVVDNDSKDNSADLIRKEFPQIELIRAEKNLGYAGGNYLAYDWGLKKKMIFSG